MNILEETDIGAALESLIELQAAHTGMVVARLVGLEIMDHDTAADFLRSLAATGNNSELPSKAVGLAMSAKLNHLAAVLERRGQIGPSLTVIDRGQESA